MSFDDAYLYLDKRLRNFNLGFMSSHVSLETVVEILDQSYSVDKQIQSFWRINEIVPCAVDVKSTQLMYFSKVPKFSAPRNVAVIHLKVKQKGHT